MNSSRPAVEEEKGHRGCCWKLNLKKVGTVDAIFGYCSVCEKLSKHAWPCPYGAPGGKQCPGIIQGNLDRKRRDLTPPMVIYPERLVTGSIGTLLAKQLGAAVTRLGFSEFLEELITAVRLGMREATLAPQGLASGSWSVSPSNSLTDLILSRT